MVTDVYLGFVHCSPESELSEIGSRYHRTLTSFCILKHRRNEMRHLQQRSKTPSYTYYINIFYILCLDEIVRSFYFQNFVHCTLPLSAGHPAACHAETYKHYYTRGATIINYQCLLLV